MDYHPGASRPKSEREDSYTNIEKEKERTKTMTTRKNKLTALTLNMLSLRSRARTRPVSFKGFLESLREYYLANRFPHVLLLFFTFLKTFSSLGMYI
jgi:hypothetical protein